MVIEMERKELESKLNQALNLLKEAREQITDKPWDDPTHLHKRISEELNLPVSYPEHFNNESENDNGRNTKRNSPK